VTAAAEAAGSLIGVIMFFVACTAVVRFLITRAWRQWQRMRAEAQLRRFVDEVVRDCPDPCCTDGRCASCDPAGEIPQW
jgi:hypothetical protein